MSWDICFIDTNIQQKYTKLEDGTSEEKELRINLLSSFRVLSDNPLSGKQIRHSLIPKSYLRKFGIDNLWKYDLPHGWRLVYSLASMNEDNLCLIVEWFSHKQYERRFKY